MQPATRIRSGQGAIWLNDVNCSGSESKLLDCHFNNVTYQCYHWHDIGVHCFINCTTEDEGMIVKTNVLSIVFLKKILYTEDINFEAN